MTVRLLSIINAFSSAFGLGFSREISPSTVAAFSPGFNSGFSSGSNRPTPVTGNSARGGLALRLSAAGSARTRKPRDIAGTLKNELTASQTTLSQLTSMLTSKPRNMADMLRVQLDTAQKTLAQLISILPQ